MSEIRVPGILWAILIIVVIAFVHENEMAIQNAMGIEPWLIDVLVAVLVGVLKGLSLGTEQLNQALDIIDRLLSSKRYITQPREGMRGEPEPTPSAVFDPSVVESIPERPNPVTTWLFG